MQDRGEKKFIPVKNKFQQDKQEVRMNSENIPSGQN